MPVADVKPAHSPTEIADFLQSRHGQPVSELELLRGGFWSAAYAYRVGEDQLVLRLGSIPFDADLDATAFTAPDLPVPEIVATGEAFGQPFAISRRHFGSFLEDTDNVGPALARLLAALRAASPPPPAYPWHDWLAAQLQDDPASRTHGWRALVAADPVVDELFTAAVARFHELLPACPARNDLIHGDLLHQNVLVTPDGADVTAVFSWKCSTVGDFLFDTAWCTFWGGWHPGIEKAEVWNRTVAAPDLSAADLTDAGIRHHCYELHIGAAHLGWSSWVGDGELPRIAARLQQVLDRGPLST